MPIVDRVLREGSGKGVRAIIVYPMNALANRQLGELEKFLGKANPKVTFARYTGQEGRDEREKTLKSRPDILLTNYGMLELMLTRPRERQALIASAENLSFLVLDELHTYRDRQGADVAMLIRRLRGAVSHSAIQCIGTSATLAGPGTKAEQRQEVAELASRIFGVQIPAANIVGETLRRATTGKAEPAALQGRLSKPTPSTWAELQADPLAVWAEHHFGFQKDDEGNLARDSTTRSAYLPASRLPISVSSRNCQAAFNVCARIAASIPIRCSGASTRPLPLAIRLTAVAILPIESGPQYTADQRRQVCRRARRQRRRRRAAGHLGHGVGQRRQLPRAPGVAS